VRFDLVTLFPEMFRSFLEAGLLGRAVASGTIAVRFASPREFGRGVHRAVDDTPYGGGSGMVMAPGPVAAALSWLEHAEPELPRAHRVLLTPQGQLFTQAHARRFCALPALALVCGRYEGFDERIRATVDEEVSLGDFVLTGGEVAAMAVIDATGRLVPGVIGNACSLDDESHSAGLLEYPQYTRPVELGGVTVPEVLRSGDHAAIARWRRWQSLVRTRERRPDLFARLALSSEDLALLEHGPRPRPRARR
jgi:tRNA (guanine37-N1)-methyltransferase